MLRRAANFFRARLRKWLGVVDPPTPDASVVVKQPGLSIAASLLQKAGEKLIARRFEAPVLPTGVIPPNYAYDAANDPGGLGQYLAFDNESTLASFAFANSFNTGLGFPGYAYLSELSQRSEYRAPSETIASEMTREWIKLTVKGKTRKNKDDGDRLGKDAAPPTDEGASVKKDDAPDDEVDGELEDKLEEIEQALEEFKVREAFRLCAQLDGLFGRAQIFIDIESKGRNVEEVRQLPLIISPETIPVGSLKKFKVIEPIWTTPYTYNASDPVADDFYVPRAWYVLGRRTHADRLLTFVMREVPDMLKPAYNFGGLSMTQLMEPYVYQWLRTRNSVSDLVHNFSVMVLLTDMSKVLGGDVTAGTSLIDRIKLFVANRDNQGLTIADKDTEELVAINVPLSGLEELLSQAQRMMSAPSHIPLVKLVGEAASGLNASDEGAIKIFYDFVRACQQQFFAPHLKTVLQIIQLHLYGEIDDAISFEFIPLSAPTVKELAEIRKSNAETDGVYIDKGVISPEEVREKISSDPESGYTNLTGPVPEPPDLGMMDAGAEINENAAQADHERGEESAQAAHKRQMQADKQNNKGAKK